MTPEEIQTKAKVWRLVGELGCDEAARRLDSSSGSATCSVCYVSDIINHLLELIRDAPIYSDCRNSLLSIRDGIFLELPEDRMSLLCEVGRVINRSVPKKGVTNVLYEEFWDDIRDYLTPFLLPNA